jgi:hypothetical protein
MACRLTWLCCCIACAQLLFSSHSSLHDDDEAEHTNMEDKGLPLECVLSECTVSRLHQHTLSWGVDAHASTCPAPGQLFPLWQFMVSAHHSMSA